MYGRSPGAKSSARGAFFFDKMRCSPKEAEAGKRDETDRRNVAMPQKTML